MTFDALRFNLFFLILWVIGIPFFASSAWGQYTSGDRIISTTATRARTDTSLTSSSASIAVNTKGTIVGGPYIGSGNTLSWFLIRWDTLSADRYTAEFDGTGTRLFGIFSPSAITLSTSQAPYWDSSPPAGPVVPLQWNQSQRAQYFEVYRNGQFYARIDNPNATSFTNNAGLSAGATYTFLVAARRNDDALSFTQSNTLTLTMPSQPQSPPSVTTNAASGITASSATLNLTVNPNGAATTAYFEHGLTTSYGSTTTPGNFGSGNSSVSGNSVWSGLQPNTTYHYRAVASNSGGASYGSDVTFSTLPPPSPTVSRVVAGQSEDNHVPASSVRQWVDFYGTNFVYNSGFQARLTWPAVNGLADYNTASPYFQSIDSTHFRLNILVGTSASSWPEPWQVQVTSSGQVSALQSFSVLPYPEGFVLQSPTTSESNGSPTVTLNWGASSYAEWYIVERDGVTVSPTLSSSARSYTDNSSLNRNQSYSYRIKAINRVGSIMSNFGSVTIPAANSPVLTITSPDAGSSWPVGSNISITWTLSGVTSGVTGLKLSILNNGVTAFGPYPLDKSAITYSWTVPSNFVTSNAVIKVETVGAVTSHQVAFTATTLNPTSPPVAVISLPDYGANYSPLPLNRSIRFSGAGSKGNMTSYQWLFSDGGTATGAEVNHTFTHSLTDGKGTAKLTVTSSTGSNTASIQFSLKGAGNNPNEAKSLDPVNTATGAFLLGFDVMPVAGRGLPFLFQGYYNSMSYRPATADLPAETPPGALGYGWTHSFETRIEIPAPEDGVRVAMISFGDGHAEKYTMASGETSWQAEPGVWNQLTESLEGRFSLLTRSQLRHDFDAFGKLDAIVDRNGNKLDIVWEDLPGVAGVRRIQKVVLPGGPADGSQTRAVLFTYRPATPTSLWKLEDPMHHFIEFTQDAAGNLISWTNERNHTTRYTYDALHQLETGIDGKNQQFVRNYYNEDRRVWKQEDPSLDVTLFTYNFPNDTTTNRLTTITRLAAPTYAAGDDRNEVTVDVHDPKLRRVQQRVRMTPPPTETWLTESWAYDPVTNDVTSRINRRGKETKFGWSNGNLIRVETPDGAVRTLDYGDSSNPTLPTLITFPDPRVKEKRQYDANGNLTAVIFPYDATQPTNNKRSFTVDGYGQVKIKLDANGVSQSSEFNVWGRPYQFTDGETKVSLAEFDDNGRQTASINPLTHRVESIFNEVGNLTGTEQADPNDPANPIVTTLIYDDNEQLIQSTDPLLHHAYSHRDMHGRVWKSEDHDRNPVIHRFNAFGQAIETENAKGGITRRTFNFAGYLMSEASPAPSTNVITYQRDENGNATETLDGDGVRTTFEHDAMDRRVVTKRWRNATDFEQTRSSYNLMGQKEWDEDEKGQKTFCYYDLAGNHIRTLPPQIPGQPPVEFTFGYDDEGHQISATHTSSSGDATRYIEYNGRYQIKRLIDENGHKEDFVHDDAGRLWKHIQEAEDGTLSIVTEFEHDSLHRLTKVTPPTGPPITFKYDKASRRVEMSDPTGTTKWTHNALNQISGIELPTGLTLGFTYDSLGATASVTYPGNRTASYTTDAAGRFASVTDWSTRTISQTYTAGDRPLRLQFPNNVHSDFGHDSVGRLNDIVHQRGTDAPLLHLPYGFDQYGKLTTVPDVQITEPESSYPRTYGKANELLTIAGSPVTHDHRGNVKTAKLSPSSPATDTLTWDYANRLSSGSTGGAAFTNTFNGLGHRISTTRSGVTTGFLTDDRGSMPRILAETDAAGTPTAFYLYAGNMLLARISTDGSALWYALDRQGNTVLLTDGSGSTAALYQYDPFGVPVSASGSFASSNPFRYLGGLGVWDNGDGTLHARARSYHPRLGRFLSRDALYGNNQNGQSLNRYVYALNDPFGFSDPSGYKPVSDLIYAYWNAYSEWLHNVSIEMFWYNVGVGRGFIGAAATTLEAAYAARDPYHQVVYSLESAISTYNAVSGWVDQGYPVTSEGIGTFVGGASFGALTSRMFAAKGAPHGNSRLSPNLQHRYEIVENSSGDVVKTGISGKPLNQNGTSGRANGQVNRLNAAEGDGAYSARVPEINLPGRQAGLDAEQAATTQLNAAGNSLRLQRRPKP
jgi:RHS repeat-associated protein